ncbi:MAG: rRNA pseudouridine synthase [Candidatus Magasanikbacteria bacterium]|nr:rRNA pseudouridine synthase [Candidatus Magasanikbacteria bacterium]
MLIRLQKHIADLGIASRRKAEELIAAGKITINGQIITRMGVMIDPEKDKVSVSDSDLTKIQKIKNKIEARPRLTYIALNKPIDYICDAGKEREASIFDLLRTHNVIGNAKQNPNKNIFSVEELDKESEGLVLLSNDKTLAHSCHELEKEYEISIDNRLSRPAEKVLGHGMKLGNEFVQGIHIAKKWNKGKRSIITIILKKENKQIRKMFGILGYHVLSLKRIRIGKLKLNTLPTGKWRYIKREQIR